MKTKNEKVKYHQKIQQIKEQNESKVEFFSSQSSFQSSISKSRVHEGQRQIYQQTELIFLSLERELKQLPKQQVKDRVQNIMNRANILCHFTIPEQIQAQQNFNIQTNETTLQCYEKIKQLVNNYEKYKLNEIGYKDFYEIYKKYEKVRNFKKQKNKVKLNQTIHFQFTQKVQINHIILQSPNKKYKALHQKTFPVAKFNYQDNRNVDQPQIKNIKFSMVSLSDQLYKLKTDNKQLIQKVFVLKKQITDLTNSHQQQLQLQKTNFYQRITNIINLKLQSLPIIQDKYQHLSPHNSKLQFQTQIHKQQNYKSSATILIEELAQTNSNLLNQISLNRNNLEKIINLQQDIDMLTMENINLKQQIQKTQKIATSHLLCFNDDLIKLQKQNQKKQVLKTISKRNQILITQIQLLKRQLQTQRESAYKKKFSLNYEKDIEFNKMKEQISRKNKEIKNILFKVDETQTKLIIEQEKNRKNQENLRKLKMKTQKYEQNIESLKTSNLAVNKQFYRTGESFHAKQSNQLLMNSVQKFRKSQEKCNSPKIKVIPYLSDVIQGFVYYKCLQKQFRYRFRRACLKQKQLLYKKNNFQVGIISNNSLQNNLYDKIYFTLFLTNYSNQKMQNIKISLIHSNSENKVINSNPSEKYCLRPGDQVKINTQFLISSYPLGTLIVGIYGMKQPIRLLLPSNVIKLFCFEQKKVERSEMEKDSQRMVLIGESKIYKKCSTLLDYLIGRSQSKESETNLCRSENRFGIFGIHEKTNSRVKIYIQQRRQTQQIQILYRKQSGNNDLIDYLMRNIKLIIEKEAK